MLKQDMADRQASRRSFIDMAKGLGILMITYGHLTEHGNPVDNWMALFKISIFYVVAGYLEAMLYSRERVFRPDYLRTKLQRIMIPYVFYSLTIIVVRGVVTWFRYKDVSEIVKQDFFNTVTLKGVNTLWFLPTLFIGEVLFVLVLRSRKKWVFLISFVSTILIGFLLSGKLLECQSAFSGNMQLALFNLLQLLCKSLIALWFIEVGFIGKRMLSGVPVRIKGAIGMALLAFTVVVGVTVSRGVDFNNLRFGANPIWFFLCGVLGSYGTLVFFEWLESRVVIRPLVFWGENSLILMAAQRVFLLINFSLGAVERVFRIEDHVCLRYYCQTLIALMITLLMCFSIVKIIKGNRVLGYIYTGRALR